MKNYHLLEVYPRVVTVPDSFVVRQNKIKTTDKATESHGEAKLYVGSKEMMRGFFGGEGFVANCFMLKSDLIRYLSAIEGEYLQPSQSYRGETEFRELFNARHNQIDAFDADIIPFQVRDQNQIQGNRGYVNSTDIGYKIIRELSLPLVSFLLIKKVEDKEGNISFYWRLYVDFDAIEEIKSLSLVFNYGKKQETPQQINQEINSQNEQLYKRGRDGQQKYREQLLNQCPFCPFTRVTDERLLIASHIKPWAASNEKEKIDPYNGFILTPTYDLLFDKGFISFTDEKRLLVSNFLSPRNVTLLGLVNNSFIQMLPMDEKRQRYLQFHRENVFKE